MGVMQYHNSKDGGSDKKVKINSSTIKKGVINANSSQSLYKMFTTTTSKGETNKSRPTSAAR